MNKAFFLLICTLCGAALGSAVFYILPYVSGPLATRTRPVTNPVTNPVRSEANPPERAQSQVSGHSYHEGIMRVAPSVVSLYSSETIYTAPPQRLSNGSVNPSIAPYERRSTSQGSGVIIGENGIILTNLHLVVDADDINVVLSTGSLHSARLVGSDRETDLAVVQIDAKGLPAVNLGDAPRLRVGDIVLAIGNPFGVGQTVTQGIISATRRRVAGASAWQNFVQIDAAINPGNSGGALVNPDGQLVGINTAVFQRDNGAEGIGFAIPAELAAQVVPQMIENGRVIRGWLGIGADDLPMFPGINRVVDQGAVITAVLANSPAELGGLQPFDVVVRVNSMPITNATELLLLVSSLTPGDEVSIDITRNGDLMTLLVVLDERPVIGN